MTRWLGILGAAVLLAAGGSARAEESAFFDAFHSICAAHPADPAAATAVADKAGWMTLNSAMVPVPSAPAFRLNSYQVRLHSDASTVLVLIAGDGVAAAAAETFPASVCMLVSKPVDPAALARAEQWVGVPFMVAQGSIKIYIYGEGPRGHVVVKPADIKAAIAAGRVDMMIAGSTPQGEASMLGMIHLQSPR